MFPYMTNARARVGLVGALIAIAIVAYGGWRLSQGPHAELGTTTANAEQSDGSRAAQRDRNSVDLSDSQLASVKVEPIAERPFPIEKEAIGSIDFNEEMAVQ